VPGPELSVLGWRREVASDENVTATTGRMVASAQVYSIDSTTSS